MQKNFDRSVRMQQNFDRANTMVRQVLTRFYKEFILTGKSQVRQYEDIYTTHTLQLGPVKGEGFPQSTPFFSIESYSTVKFVVV